MKLACMLHCNIFSNQTISQYQMILLNWQFMYPPQRGQGMLSLWLCSLLEWTICQTDSRVDGDLRHHVVMWNETGVHVTLQHIFKSNNFTISNDPIESVASFNWDWRKVIPHPHPHPVWIINHMLSKMWDEIIQPFPNFNRTTVEVWEWISNFIPHLIMAVIGYPCWD